jgi:outer membrane protein insertion porin family
MMRRIALLLLLLPLALTATSLQNYKIKNIYFQFDNEAEAKNIGNYRMLINFEAGDPFNYRNIRQSMENLYKTASFENIEIKINRLPNKELDLYFFLKLKWRIKTIKIKEKSPFRKNKIRKAIFSLQKNTSFDHTKLRAAVEEIKKFFKDRGYNNPIIRHTLIKKPAKSSMIVKLDIESGAMTGISSIQFNVNNPAYKDYITRFFSVEQYKPIEIYEKIEKLRIELKKSKYYFPVIKLTETFVNDKKSLVDISIDVDLGYQYIFKFVVMKEKIDLIATVWARKVFEKWAERESKARILDYLKNKGFLDAVVESKIEVIDSQKIITFTVQKNQKYILGQISFAGNESIPTGKLNEIVTSDELIYDKVFNLRADNLQIDLEVLKLYYYSRGFPFIKINMIPTFVKNIANIRFQILEGEKVGIESILFEGNTRFPSKELLTPMKTKVNGPYVEQQFNNDMQRLRDLYLNQGYPDIEIKAEISPGTNKSILISIDEGTPYSMGDLIVFGASRAQKKLLKTLFPLQREQPFNQSEITDFKNEIENNSIFSDLKIDTIRREDRSMDVIVKVTPNRSKFYGFGIGWENSRGLRGSPRWTFEYSEQNIFNTYSTFSALFQIGTREDRIGISYESPYFFRRRLNSSLLIWNENETYPSYKFNRHGIGESLSKRLSSNSYIMASLKWYRTTLKDLEVTESGVDQIGNPFDTTAFSLAYVIENRDDPFNPTTGDFFSSNIKIGFPLLEKDYSFFKFLWSYQKNFKFLKRGSLAFSVRNGFAAGDMSITERFFAGGIHTFRGTYNDRLGPIDPETHEPRGGNALVLFNIEATFPLEVFPIDDLYYCVFADVGNVFWRASDFDINKVERAIGFGIKYRTPLGPLRLDFAYNLRELAERNFLVHIGIGNVL